MTTLLGRRDKGTGRPRPTLGRYRWLTPLEQLRIRATAHEGISANRIARAVRRDRRTIDRVLSDPRGIRLAFVLASRPSGCVLVPDVVGTLRRRELLEIALPLLLERLAGQRDALGVRVWTRMVARLETSLLSWRWPSRELAVLWAEQERKDLEAMRLHP